jgi:very-short-patch-repair endonuclease
VAELAARQWNVLDLDDLRASGLSRQAVWKRVQAGRLFPKYPGVFALASPKLTLEGVFLAAVKACGLGAVLSHFSAAVLYGWFRWDGRFPEVTASNPRTHAGIYTHRSNHIERTVYKGIPVTPVIRTLTDLSSTLPFAGTRRAVNEALNQRVIKPAELVTSHHRGAKQLRAILATAAPTRNEYEDIVLAVLLQAGLPMPEVNQRRLRYFPDFRWPGQRVLLEADSAQFHDQMLARADDRRRQEVLEAHGDTVIRTTWTEITTRPDRVVARVRDALAA